MRGAVMRFSIRSRRRKAKAITAFMAERRVKSLLLCGSAPGAANNEGIVERAVVNGAERVVGFNIVYLGPQPWPFVIADARAMPFADDEYDLIVSNAIIEHVGDTTDQQRFVAEHCRVGKNWVITTPNRWFPVESHTAAVLRHWRPNWRARQTEFTRLLSRREFRALLPPGTRIDGRPWSATFIAYSTLVETQ